MPALGLIPKLYFRTRRNVSGWTFFVEPDDVWIYYYSLTLANIMAEEAPRTKRSRFDQTEPEPRKASRFDRRSRSPSGRESEPRRSRSPLSKSARSPNAVDPAAAAGKS